MYIYQFFLGNHSALGWAEIRSLKLGSHRYNANDTGNGSLNIQMFNRLVATESNALKRLLQGINKSHKDLKVSNSILVISNKSVAKMQNMLQHMGGPKKVARVIAVLNIDSQNKSQQLAMFLTQLIRKILQDSDVNLKYFRINLYGDRGISLKGLFKTIKDDLRKIYNKPIKLQGRADSLVANTATTHKITTNNGLELNITLRLEQKIVLISRTIAVQNYNVFSVLEYKKPHRDMEIGMLPMKLALIMLNLAQLKQDMGFWDPMVGLGTLLMAGQLKGLYAYGSDKDHIAVRKSKENVEWLLTTGLVKNLKYRVFRFDIFKDPMSNKILRDIARFGKFNAVVTEGYLGPVRHKPFISKKQLAIWATRLGNLYTKFLRNVSPLLDHGGRVVFITPIFKYYNKEHELRLFKLVPPINKHRYNVISFDTGPLVWENRHSVVIRNIHVLEKK